MIYFISGHLDLTEEEFQTHYAHKILLAIKNGDSFVVGDARGADTFAQEFLDMHDAFQNVVVFHMFDNPRNNAGGFSTAGGFKNDKERDAAMTNNSDADIAWVRPGREKSGTAKNLSRRKQNNFIIFDRKIK